MSILNVDKIQPIGGGSTITVDATDIQATSSTITASKFVGSGDLSVTGVSTFTGNIDANGDLDVDGHTNLDNLSVAGVSTFTGNADFSSGVDVTGTITGNNLTLSDNDPELTFTDLNNNPDYRIKAESGNLSFEDTTNGNVARLRINANGHVDVTDNLDVSGDLDVDGHTNLDHVSIAGVTTMTGNLTINSTSNARAIILPDNKRIYFGDGEDFWIGSNGSNGEVSGSLYFYNHQYHYDNVYARFGHGADLNIFHNASDSFIDNNTGSLFIDSADNIIFRTNPATERLRITSSGQLGIGLAPSSPLHAYHATTNTIAQFQSGDAGAGILLKDNTHYTRLESTNGTFKIDVDAGSQIGSEVISFQMSTSEKVRINSDGDLLIGRTSTIDTSEVLGLKGPSGDHCTLGMTVSNNTAAGIIAFNDSDGDFRGRIQYNHNGDSMDFRTAGTSRMVINSNGDNGFLKIADNNTSSVSNHGFRFGSWGIQMRDTNGYNHWYIRRNYGGWQASPQVTFKGNGHTGLNRTDPAETLDVDGGARFRSYVYIGDGFYIKSNAFGGNTNADTGISINQGGRGGCSLLLVSRNYNSGTGTSAGIYRIKWYYDGNNAPNTHHMSGDNWISFGVSGSNTLTVNGGGGNQVYGIFHITG